MQPNNPTLEEYIRLGEPSQRERAEAWRTAIGLQAVDGLQVSQYLLHTASEHVEGTISQEEAEKRIVAYYQTEAGRKEEAGTDEADQVSSRIVRVLSSQTFTFSPSHLASIHRELFSGILSHAGTYRDYDISKREWVLNNASVLYGSADYISHTLNYDFAEERKFSYRGKSTDEVIEHMASFVAGIWQIHPFGEGNTRTAAVFLIQYLRSLGYTLDNAPFNEHSWYFRNALVRANYNNLPAGITRTTRYLELFLRNTLLGEENELRNRYLHVDWNHAKEEKTSVETPKTSVETPKNFGRTTDNTKKTSVEIVEILRQNSCTTAAEMAKLLGKNIRSIELQLRKLTEKGLIRHVGPNKGGHWEVL